MADIIINEFLTFVQNKIDVLDELSIVQICVTNFTDAEIEEGKAALYKACSDGAVRNIQRKGDDKRKKNVKDVIKLLKEVDPDVTPTFVAKDLNRLPPVSFDYVDVTRLLKDLSMMRTELTDFKTKFSVELTDLRNSLNSHKQGGKSSPQAMATPKNNKSSTPATPLPLMAAPQPKRTQEVLARSSHTPTYRDIVYVKDRTRETKNARIPSTGSGETCVATDCTVVRGAPIIANELPATDASFKIVEYKKRKSKITNMRGTSVAQCKIQVADPVCSIYISRALKTVSDSDIEEHIKDMGEECISVERLTQNRETSFNSFKVKIHASKVNTFLDANFWPAGLVYRRFKERQLRTALSKN